MNDIDLRERKCPVALKKFFRKKKYEILIFFKNKVICLPKSSEGNTERFRPNAKKCIYIH